MGRIRTIKPEFFLHDGLYDAESATGLPLRLAFAGLWTLCDREGRFEWRPRRMKPVVLPYDKVDFSDVLDALRDYGFVIKYAAAGRDYGAVPGFSRHQVVNNRERQSVIPAPPKGAEGECRDAAGTRGPRDTDSSQRKGKEGNGFPVPGEGKSSDTVSGHRPGEPEAVANRNPSSLQEIVWQQGLARLARITRRPEVKLRALMGRWCRDHGNAKVLEALDAANGKADPLAYLNKYLAPPARGPGKREQSAGSDASYLDYLSKTLGTAEKESNNT